ncbi:hypothetical protein BHL53_14400 [Bacillus cereus]|nr:hypothetical protein BHL53_14400 [Bacillus cereus]
MFENITESTIKIIMYTKGTKLIAEVRSEGKKHFYTINYFKDSWNYKERIDYYAPYFNYYFIYSCPTYFQLGIWDNYYG